MSKAPCRMVLEMILSAKVVYAFQNINTASTSGSVVPVITMMSPPWAALTLPVNSNGFIRDPYAHTASVYE